MEGYVSKVVATGKPEMSDSRPDREQGAPVGLNTQSAETNQEVDDTETTKPFQCLCGSKQKE